MLALISRLLGLFSLKSRRSLFILFGVILAIAYLYPNVIEPSVAKLSIGIRVNQLAKLNAMDRAKLKEPALRDSYTRILADVGRHVNVFQIEARKKDLKLLDNFRKDNLGNFLVAGAVWILLGFIGLLSRDKLGPKIGVFFVFLALGLGSGLLVGLMPIIKPFSLFVILVLGLELLLLSFVGTMVRSLED
jgi:hypothetical protein